MLVLTRKKGDGVVVGDNIIIKILDVSNDRIRIGIDAPPNIKISRSELYDTEKFNIQAAVNKPTSKLLSDMSKDLKRRSKDVG